MSGPDFLRQRRPPNFGCWRFDRSPRDSRTPTSNKGAKARHEHQIARLDHRIDPKFLQNIADDPGRVAPFTEADRCSRSSKEIGADEPTATIGNAQSRVVGTKRAPQCAALVAQGGRQVLGSFHQPILENLVGRKNSQGNGP